MDCGGHFNPKRMAHEILDCGLFQNSMFVDAYAYCKSCKKCQMFASLSKRNEIPLNSILVYEVFYVWGMDFMRPFPSSGAYYIFSWLLIMYLIELRESPLKLILLQWF